MGEFIESICNFVQGAIEENLFGPTRAMRYDDKNSLLDVRTLLETRLTVVFNNIEQAHVNQIAEYRTILEQDFTKKYDEQWARYSQYTNDVYENKKKEYEAMISERDSEIVRLEKQIGDLTKQIYEYEDKKKEYETTVSKKDSELDVLEKQNRDLVEKFRIYESGMEKYRENEQAAQENRRLISEATDTIRKLEIENMVKEQRISKLTKEADNNKMARRTEYENLKREHGKLQTILPQVLSTASNVDRTISMVKELKEENRNLKDLTVKWKMDYEQLKEDRDLLQEKIGQYLSDNVDDAITQVYNVCDKFVPCEDKKLVTRLQAMYSKFVNLLAPVGITGSLYEYIEKFVKQLGLKFALTGNADEILVQLKDPNLAINSFTVEVKRHVREYKEILAKQQEQFNLLAQTKKKDEQLQVVVQSFVEYVNEKEKQISSHEQMLFDVEKMSTQFELNLEVEEHIVSEQDRSWLTVLDFLDYNKHILERQLAKMSKGSDLRSLYHQQLLDFLRKKRQRDDFTIKRITNYEYVDLRNNKDGSK